jgi:hypothetical protein
VSNQYAISPSFGGKLQSPAYYAGCNSIIATLRKMATLRTISNHLNRAGFLTPTGLEWNKDRLANYLRSTAIVAVGATEVQFN